MLDDVEKLVDRPEVTGGCRVKRLLHQVVARDVDRVDAVHGSRVGVENTPAVEPVVDARQVDELSPEWFGIAAGCRTEGMKAGGPVVSVGVEQLKQALTQFRRDGVSHPIGQPPLPATPDGIAHTETPPLKTDKKGKR